MEEESGFYKVINSKLILAHENIHSKNYKLIRTQKDTYTYPVDGWTWFDTKAAAMTAFNIKDPAPVTPPAHN